jgi:hypothetical protein
MLPVKIGHASFDETLYAGRLKPSGMLSSERATLRQVNHEQRVCTEVPGFRDTWRNSEQLRLYWNPAPHKSSCNVQLHLNVRTGCTEKTKHFCTFVDAFRLDVCEVQTDQEVVQALTRSRDELQHRRIMFSGSADTMLTWNNCA